jgi:hypothetical protein
MKAFVRVLILACAGFCLLAAGASANHYARKVSIITKPLATVPCSVTASLAVDYRAGSMTYHGGVSCAGGVGVKTLDVVPQVFRAGPHLRRWRSLSLVGRYQGPTAINPLRLTAGTPAVLGHIYRLLVYARVVIAGRQTSLTVCAGCAGAPTSSSSSTLSIRPVGNYEAEPGTTASVRGTPCFVSEEGLDFTGVNSTYVVNYGGYTACPGIHPVGQRSLTVCVQVANRINGQTVWFTVNGSCISAGPSTSQGVYLNTARTAFLGHGYRIIATATVRYPTATGMITSSATTHSVAAGP